MEKIHLFPIENMLNYYDILGINKNSSLQAIKDGFRKKAKKIHPDVNSENKHDAEEQMRLLLLAYNVLSNPVKRKAYEREFFSLKKISEFDYREFLKNKSDDMYAQSKLIFYDILNGHNEEAIKLYEKLTHTDGFQLKNFLSHGDYLDCLFLLAEEFQNQKQYVKSFFMFKTIITVEKRKPYFYYFIAEVTDRLRYLVATKLQKQKSNSWCLLHLENLLNLDFPNKDKAFFCKKIAEIYSEMEQKERATIYFKKALSFDKRIGGTKKLIEKMGLKEVSI